LSPPAAHLVQQRFQVMGEIGHFSEAEGGAAALHGVRGPENGVDRLGVRLPGLEAQQAALHDFQPFGAFLEEDLMKLGQVDSHGGRSGA
jgi:hypothetical protein